MSSGDNNPAIACLPNWSSVHLHGMKRLIKTAALHYRKCSVQWFRLLQRDNMLKTLCIELLFRNPMVESDGRTNISEFKVDVWVRSCIHTADTSGISGVNYGLVWVTTEDRQGDDSWVLIEEGWLLSTEADWTRDKTWSCFRGVFLRESFNSFIQGIKRPLKVFYLGFPLRCFMDKELLDTGAHQVSIYVNWSAKKCLILALYDLFPFH